jgi:hypothetical protein
MHVLATNLHTVISTPGTENSPRMSTSSTLYSKNNSTENFQKQRNASHKQEKDFILSHKASTEKALCVTVVKIIQVSRAKHHKVSAE